jgi:hypothetical protein
MLGFCSIMLHYARKGRLCRYACRHNAPGARGGVSNKIPAGEKVPVLEVRTLKYVHFLASCTHVFLVLHMGKYCEIITKEYYIILYYHIHTLLENPMPHAVFTWGLMSHASCLMPHASCLMPHVSAHLPISPSEYLPICPSTYLRICLYTYMRICVYAYLYLHICASTGPPSVWGARCRESPP